MNELVAVVLAGGEGSRFWPLTHDKVLFPFLGKPFIAHTIQHTLPKQVSSMVIVANPRNKTALESMQFPVPHQVVVQEQPLGMADALLTAEAFVVGKRLLILIADDLFEPSLLEDVIQAAEQSDSFAMLPGWKTSSYFPGGYFRLDGNRVMGIVEKPGAGNEPSSYMNISGHYIANSDVLFQALKNTRRDTDDIYEAALTSLMHDHVVSFVPYDGYFASLKYPWQVLSVMELLLQRVQSHQGEDVMIKNYVTIEGPVYIGNHVKIMEYTKIVGPCYIGDHTIVGNNNVIRGSMIGNQCVTGFNTDITRSYIGNDCWFHSNYVGDSILEHNISMGSGTVLANLRLDEQNIHSVVKQQKISAERNKLGSIIGSHVRIGVNTGIMPGVKIGSGSFVGAGITVAQDIPTQSFVTGKTELHIEQNTKVITHDREAFKKKI